VAYGPRREPSGGDQVRAMHSEEGMLGWKWWTRRELADAAEPLWPPELARLLAELDGRKA
jgi:hypothetical protein